MPKDLFPHYDSYYWKWSKGDGKVDKTQSSKKLLNGGARPHPLNLCIFSNKFTEQRRETTHYYLSTITEADPTVALVKIRKHERNRHSLSKQTFLFLESKITSEMMPFQ